MLGTLEKHLCFLIYPSCLPLFIFLHLGLHCPTFAVAIRLNPVSLRPHSSFPPYWARPGSGKGGSLAPKGLFSHFPGATHPPHPLQNCHSSCFPYPCSNVSSLDWGMSGLLSGILEKGSGEISLLSSGLGSEEFSVKIDSLPLRGKKASRGSGTHV